MKRNNKNGKKITLFKNFRSRKEVLDITNLVFKNIMSKKLGDIDYTEEEYLNLGSSYPGEGEEKYKPELHIIGVEKEEIEDESEEGDLDLELPTKNSQIEAKFVAGKIKELIDSRI